DGDAITLGPVVFEFTATVIDEPTGRHDVADQSTRIVSVDRVKRTRGKGEALAPQGAGAEALNQMRRSATRTMQAVSRPRASNPQHPPRRGARASAAPAARPARGGAPARAASPANAPRGLSAAERARILRESPGLVGKAKIFWLEASPKKRKLISAGGGVVAL